MTDLLERVTQALADRYTIEREIGSGGMATVYLAEDQKHHRPVAIKVLRPELAAALGPERFLREIELTARLNHPHILPLLDSGEAEGLLFYVMPYVEGESLRERLALERQLPLEEALRIAAEVADALDFAHQHNVLHRDIKPENILLESKHAVVADFGIARAIDAAGGTRLTETGIAVGTPEYMSPEQAGGGKDLDGRSDVYALGCVLHEMLAGQPPFTGPTVESLVRQHLSAEPPAVTALRPSVPEGVVAALTRSLAKAPADRFSSAGAFGEAIAPSGVSPPPGAVRVEQRVTRRRPMVGGIVGVAAAVIAAAVVGTQLLTSGPITVTTSNITRVTHEAGIEYQPAISPDGEEVAYVVGPIENSRLVVRGTVDAGRGGESRPAVEVGDQHMGPRWTPDGASLRFYVRTGSGWSWREVGKLGGSVRTVPRPWPGDNVLSPDGTRVVARSNDSIFTYTADTGEPELLGVHPVEHSGQHSFVWSPDGQLIAYVNGGGQWHTEFLRQGWSSIWIVDAGGGEPVRVTGDEFLDFSPVWLDTDHLLFVSNRDGPQELYLVEVSARGPRGEPRKVAGVTDAHTISYSIAGSKLAFSKATLRQNIWSYSVDSGTVSVSDGHRVTSDNAIIEAHDISTDGRWIVYASNLRGSLDIYKRAVKGGDPTRITDGPSDENDPRWSPDGTEIAFYQMAGARRPVMVVSANGGIPAQVATDSAGWLPLWSPSGLELAFTSYQSGQYETSLVSREAVGRPWGEARQVTDFGCWPSDWAPDGSGVLCTVVGESGFEEIVLVSREGAELWRYDPSTAGLTIPSIHQVFSRDGSTIYAAGSHENGTEGVWAIPVQGGGPSLVIAYDDPEIDPKRWLVVGRDDRLYLTVGQTDVDIWVADVEVGQ
jgi:serine/threonine-protein kinase